VASGNRQSFKLMDANKDKKMTGNRNSNTAVRTDTEYFYYGTRDELRPGDTVPPADPFGPPNGGGSYFTYMSPNLDAATWSAELAAGDAPPRVYVVESDDDIEDVSELIAKNAPQH